MKLLSQTIYRTDCLNKGSEINCEITKLKGVGLVEIAATIYVPTINLKGGAKLHRSHYSNIKQSYAIFQYIGNPKELEKSIIRETCYGDFISIGSTDGGVIENCIEKLINGAWVVLSGKKYIIDDIVNIVKSTKCICDYYDVINSGCKCGGS